MKNRKSVFLAGVMSSKIDGSLSVCEQLQEQLFLRGWKVYIASGKRNRLARYLDLLFTALHWHNHFDVAIIEVYSGLALIWEISVAFVLKLLRRPYVLALYGGALPQYASKMPLIMSLFLNSAAIVIAPSRYLQEALKPYRDDVILLRYGVDLSEFTFRLRSTPIPNLVTLRGIHEIYNPALAPKVLGLILPEYPDATLTMIGPDRGDGSWENTQKVSLELGVNKSMQMLGKIPRSDVGMRLNSADIYLNTPNIDNTPLSITEAMACGLCIVSTNAGGLPYLLSPGEDSLMVSCDNPKEMADAVLRILKEPGLAEHLSINARREAELYDWSNVIVKWEELLLLLLDTRS